MDNDVEGLLDFYLAEKDVVFEIAVANYFFDPIHDGFIGDSIAVFSAFG
jgi:hypothetical protein